MKKLKQFGLKIEQIRQFRQIVSEHMENVLTEKIDNSIHEILTKEADSFFKEIEPDIIKAFSEEKTIIKKALLEEIRKSVTDKLNDVDWINGQIRKIFGGY